MTTTMTPKVANPAKRGDAVVVERVLTSHRIGDTVRTETRFELWLVASVKRDGTVSKVAEDAGDTCPVPLHRLHGSGKVWVVPQISCDVPALLDAFKAREWPGREHRTYNHGRYPFDSLDEVRVFATPFKVS